jgi:cyclic beta-1,2-glucan synthetase
MGTTPDDLTRREHLRQAADHVSVGNAITSMRAIAALDWTEFFELTSDVEQVLRLDPCGAYPRMDQPSRDRCRHAVEQLARRSGLGERAVADRVLALATEAARSQPDSARAHVGYFLIDRGRPQLAQAIGYRASWSERLRRPLLAAPTWCYLGAFSLLVVGLLVGAAALLAPHVHAAWQLGLLIALAAIPASEVSLGLVTTWMLVVLPPRLLPKLDFEAGIPVEQRTLVVVPCLLESRAGIAELLEELEIRALANPDQNLYFALVTDFSDSSTAETERDQPLLDFALEGIEQLNRTAQQQRYFLLHRRRVLSSAQGCYMGWERKRGKLTELNRLLRGDKNTTFAVVTAPEALLLGVRYVITLDADTQLPREVARRLVGTMAHPLNRAVVDPQTRRVIRGYGIIQPRVGTLPRSSRKSRFARIFAGPPGIDPYTTAVSDLYQDLFGEGSFLGKGIYDVDAFQAALEGRVPEDSLLSHDLFEGGFARSALATDIEVFDEHPASYEVVASREHRWMRGDWQLLPWLLPRVPVAGGQRQPNALRALDL